MDKYLIRNQKKLRYGYTTGSCAAGAAKASVYMLFSGKKLNDVSISTPKGWDLKLVIEDIDLSQSYVSSAIVKDSGDDPDITDKIKIYARAEKIEEKDIIICGGKGIGRVTKKGLLVEVGKPAINPVPMKMIKEAIREVLPDSSGVKVTIYAPEGEIRAEKTLNRKLGIVGGISILGTTGIVEPMSKDAIKDSIALEVSVLKEEGKNKLIFVPGNYGRDFAIKKLLLKEKLIIKTSNYIGFMLDKACELEIEEILWVGHIGKMVKVGGGIFNTHSKVADGRLEILAANCAFLGCKRELIEKILKSTTTEEAILYINENKLESVYTLIAEKISKRCREFTQNKVDIGTVIFTMNCGILGICQKGNKLLEELKY